MSTNGKEAGAIPQDTCGPLTVEPRFDAGLVTVTACAGVESPVKPGDTVTATFSAENQNEVAAQMTVEAVVDGSQVATKVITLSANESQGGFTIDFTAPSTTGQFSVSVNKVSASQTGETLFLSGIGERVRGLDRATVATAGAGVSGAVLSALLR